MTRVVGVFPPSALAVRARLFAALGAAFRVRFEGRESGAWEGVDAVIVVGDFPTERPNGPVLRYIHAENLVEPSSEPVMVQLAVDDAVDERVRGRRLSDRSVATAPERLHESRPLARDDGGTAWAIAADGVQTCLVAPSELEPDEPLRDRLRAGRFLALLPLVQLLRGLTDYESWSRPGVRAAFLFDDPNLHWRSYGHIRFAELAVHARLHGYHVAFSTIPLDSWYAHAGAVRTFKSAGGSLSLTVHGNDHSFAEFAVRRSSADALGVTAQAIERIARLEQRTGLSIDRVMVPPHGLCSDEMLNAMVGMRMQALCRNPIWWSEWPHEQVQTADWHMADVAPSGGPIIKRHSLVDKPMREETVFTIFRDQPVVLYGHHYDVSSGYDVLAETAEWLRGFGQVAWSGLEALARSNYTSRVEPDGALRIRSYSRAFSVSIPDNARHVVVEMPSYESVALDRLRTGDSELELEVTNGLAVAAIPASSLRRLSIELVRHIDTPPARASGAKPRAITRRAVGETRDRLQPILERAGLSPVLRRLEQAYNRRMNIRMRERTRSGM